MKMGITYRLFLLILCATGLAILFLISIMWYDHFALALVESLVAFADLRHENEHFIGVGIGNVADALDFAIAEALGPQRIPKLVEIGRAGEANIHVGTTSEIDAVLYAALEKDGTPADEQ